MKAAGWRLRRTVVSMPVRLRHGTAVLRSSSCWSSSQSLGCWSRYCCRRSQSARDAARRSQCQNNLKQLGIGLHNFESAHGRFPPAGKSYGWCNSTNSREFDHDETTLNVHGLMLMMGYLEETAIADQYDPNAASSSLSFCLAPSVTNGPLAGDPIASGNAQLAAIEVALFRCPTDAGEPLLPDNEIYGVGNGTGIQPAKTNYDFAVEYWQWHCNAWRNTPLDIRRMFGENSTVEIGQVTDGLSHTIAMGETTFNNANGRCPPWAYRGWVQVGVDPAQGINIWTSGWTHPPNPDPGRASPESGRVGSWSWPGSMHPGGCHFLFADGSVHFLSEETNRIVMDGHAKMADGRVIEE